jgi:hypothetical protein
MKCPSTIKLPVYPTCTFMPFNGWLHFPQFGKPAWAFNKALLDHSVLPSAIHQIVILVTAASSLPTTWQPR